MIKMTKLPDKASDASAGTAIELEPDLRSKSETSSVMHSQSQSPLFQMAGEIRNKIYYYALDMGLVRSLRKPAPDPSAIDYAKLQENFEEDVLSMNLLLA